MTTIPRDVFINRYRKNKEEHLELEFVEGDDDSAKGKFRQEFAENQRCGRSGRGAERFPADLKQQQEEKKWVEGRELDSGSIEC